MTALKNMSPTSRRRSVGQAGQDETSAVPVPTEPTRGPSAEGGLREARHGSTHLQQNSPSPAPSRDGADCGLQQDSSGCCGVEAVAACVSGGGKALALISGPIPDPEASTALRDVPRGSPGDACPRGPSGACGLRGASAPTAPADQPIPVRGGENESADRSMRKSGGKDEPAEQPVPERGGKNEAASGRVTTAGVPVLNDVTQPQEDGGDSTAREAHVDDKAREDPTPTTEVDVPAWFLNGAALPPQGTSSCVRTTVPSASLASAPAGLVSKGPSVVPVADSPTRYCHHFRL